MAGKLNQSIIQYLFQGNPEDNFINFVQRVFFWLNSTLDSFSFYEVGESIIGIEVREHIYSFGKKRKEKANISTQVVILYSTT